MGTVRTAGCFPPAPASDPGQACDRRMVDNSQTGRVPAGAWVRKRCRVGDRALALQLELCLPRLVSSPAPGGSIDGLRAFSRNPGRRASKTILRRFGVACLRPCGQDGEQGSDVGVAQGGKSEG
jgi:hypothetical protein